MKRVKKRQAKKNRKNHNMQYFDIEAFVDFVATPPRHIERMNPDLMLVIKNLIRSM